MKVAVTADIHYGVSNNQHIVKKSDPPVLYEKILPKIVNKCGFHYLDQKPFIKGGVGFVGNIGWYDCSFHHVPFTELLRTSHTSIDKFLTAFSGSKETGVIIKSFPKLLLILVAITCGKGLKL